MSYYERLLPHWQPEGAALFVTWRLHGSLPRRIELLTNDAAEKTFVNWDRDLDTAASGPRWLGEERAAQCVVDALHFGERELQLYELEAWVVMVNHVHILVNPRASLQRITKAIKNYSARQAKAVLGRTGQPFWQDVSYDHRVRDRRERAKVVKYIEANPVKVGLVERIEDWRWSSAFGVPQ